MGQPQKIRFHERLQDYWDKLRAGRPFPAEREVNPDDLAEVWPSCFLISIDDVTRRLGYRYSYLGDALVAAYGDDLHSPDVSALLTAVGNTPMAKRFDEVVKERKPVMDENQFTNSNKLNIRYRSCMLPLGDKDGEVTHILGCMRWKAY